MFGLFAFNLVGVDVAMFEALQQSSAEESQCHIRRRNCFAEIVCGIPNFDIPTGRGRCWVLGWLMLFIVKSCKAERAFFFFFFFSNSAADVQRVYHAHTTSCVRGLRVYVVFPITARVSERALVPSECRQYNPFALHLRSWGKITRV